MEYSDDDWGEDRGLSHSTSEFLNKLREVLLELKGDFCMILGDSCCTSCASYEVGAEMDEEGKPYGLYWHCQDEESFDNYGDLYIGYTGHNDAGSMEAARRIIAKLTERGYRTHWAGDTGSRIKVFKV